MNWVLVTRSSEPIEGISEEEDGGVGACWITQERRNALGYQSLSNHRQVRSRYLRKAEKKSGLTVLPQLIARLRQRIDSREVSGNFFRTKRARQKSKTKVSFVDRFDEKKRLRKKLSRIARAPNLVLQDV